jgi:hypothetical protein
MPTGSEELAVPRLSTFIGDYFGNASAGGRTFTTS